jgi:hypothetical protein
MTTAAKIKDLSEKSIAWITREGTLLSELAAAKEQLNPIQFELVTMKQNMDVRLPLSPPSSLSLTKYRVELTLITIII